MAKFNHWRTLAVAAACTASLGLLASCVETESISFPGVRAFIVEVVPPGGNFGSIKTPLQYPTVFSSGGNCKAGETCFDPAIGAYAVDYSGNFLPDFNETVVVRSVPGVVKEKTIQFRNGLIGEWKFDADGKPSELIKGQEIGIRYTHGKTRIWIEDSIPAPKVGGEETRKYTLATGVSREIVFEPQTIRSIQYNPDSPSASTPMLGHYGEIIGRKGHDLVVTNIVSTGFYVTDLGDKDFNSIFVFTFSQPSRLEIGDRICEISGGTAEFTGMTQLQFPSWGVQNKERSTAEDTDPAPEDGVLGAGSCVDRITGESRPCTLDELEAMAEIVDCSDLYFDKPLSPAEKAAFGFITPPLPRVVDKAILNKANVGKLEALEASVVTIENIRLSSEFINCDDNGNGRIESGTAEADCRSRCNENIRCTELSSLEGYDQWRAWTLDGSAEISVSSASLIAGFDITKGCKRSKEENTGRLTMVCPEKRLKRVTGNLKQVLPTCSANKKACDAKDVNVIMTIIEPRFSSDLIMDTVYNDEQERLFAEKHGLPNGN